MTSAPPASQPPVSRPIQAAHSDSGAPDSAMRTAPANAAPVVRVLAPGTMVRATPGKWGWWAIQWNGDTIGYIAGALLRSSRPANSR